MRAQLYGGPRDGAELELPMLVGEVQAAVSALDLTALSEVTEMSEVPHQIAVYRLRYPVTDPAVFTWVDGAG
jgi:hypothetical protein